MHPKGSVLEGPEITLRFENNVLYMIFNLVNVLDESYHNTVDQWGLLTVCGCLLFHLGLLNLKGSSESTPTEMWTLILC